MFETLGVAKHGIIPDYIYELPFNEWYMVYGGVVLVANTLQRYHFMRIVLTSCTFAKIANF